MMLRSGASRDRLAAAAVGLLSLAGYLRTLYPGVGGGDAVRFQHLGHVLGTAHAPGYPLSVLVSHAFSYLPMGTMAYRMNVLSAVLASAAVALVCLILIRLGCRRWAAASVCCGPA